MKIADWISFIIILIICIGFLKYIIKKYFEELKYEFKYDTEKIKNKLDSLEYDIAKCREEVRNTKEKFESIQEELNIINEKLVVGKKNEKICQLVDEKKKLEEEIERLNKVNQQLVRDYWNRMNNILYYPLVTPGNWRY